MCRACGDVARLAGNAVALCEPVSQSLIHAQDSIVGSIRCMRSQARLCSAHNNSCRNMQLVGGALQDTAMKATAVVLAHALILLLANMCIMQQQAVPLVTAEMSMCSPHKTHRPAYCGRGVLLFRGLSPVTSSCIQSILPWNSFPSQCAACTSGKSTALCPLAHLVQRHM